MLRSDTHIARIQWHLRAFAHTRSHSRAPNSTYSHSTYSHSTHSPSTHSPSTHSHSTHSHSTHSTLAGRQFFLDFFSAIFCLTSLRSLLTQFHNRVGVTGSERARGSCTGCEASTRQRLCTAGSLRIVLDHFGSLRIASD